MKAALRIGLAAALMAVFVSTVVAKRHGASHHATSPTPHPRDDAEIEAATRLQVFLDRANFSPGKIDGHYNEVTLKALALYRQSQAGPQDHETTGQPDQGAEQAKSERQSAQAGDQKSEVRSQSREAKGPNSKRSPSHQAEPAPDLSGIDLSSVNPVFIQYTVTDADMKNIGSVPRGESEAVAAAKAKLPALPYRDVGQEIAEKFHVDQKFLSELNRGKNGVTLKPGDQLRVPNVEPFDLEAVKNLQPGSELAADTANEMQDETETAASPSPAGEPTSSVRIKVDVKTNMLGVFENDKLVAAYPVTVGSREIPTPIGEWKVRGVAKFPTFRYDEKMLKHGERSKNFYILKPGPNNPVGVIWIALNKRGIGIHGTDEPDTIGQAGSHGCIRLANWDIVRLAGRVKAGVPVEVK